MKPVRTMKQSVMVLGAAFAFVLGVSSLFGLVPLLAAQNVTVTNVFQNHYSYGYPIGNLDCPAGYNLPAGQYPSTYHLERGHAIHHADPKIAANDYWVYWAHFDNANYGTAEVAVFKSTNECGPYLLQSESASAYNADGAGYGFRPGGWQSRDENIFRDADQTYNADGTVASYASAYLITASNDLGTQKSSSGSTCNYANDSDAVFKMTPDYLGIDTTTNTATNGANWVFVCDQREAPVMLKSGPTYFLIVSQAAGWYPSQGAYGVSSNPLTGWTPDPISLGNSSTFGSQTADGFEIMGTQANTYVLSLDHLGGDDNKNPAYVNERHDTGSILLPVFLDGIAKTATLNWYPSWTVDNTTGVLTLPTLTNLATGAAATATVTSATGNPTSYAIDGLYNTRWASTATGTASFAASKSTTSTLCPTSNATAATTCNPSLITDLGSVQPVQQIDLSWYMIKGSEPYYNFKIAYSADNITWNTLDYTSFAPGSTSAASNLSVIPFSNNNTYGFNSLPVNFSARYVALVFTGEVVQNNSPGNYGPNLYEMAVYKSTAPGTAQTANVTVTPSTATPATDSAFTVAVTVAGPAGQPIPTGYVQLSASGYTSETYGLVNGVSSFTVPAGALSGGSANLTVSYRPDPTSVPVYGLASTIGTAGVSVSAPDAPTNLVLTQSAPGSLTATWTASVGAVSYVVNRSSDGGSTYTQIATTTSTSYLDTGLRNDSTSYCYTVAAVNGAGAGGTTAPVCSTATANFPVTNITVTQSAPGALTIAYTALANATGYVIKRAAAGSTNFSVLTTVSASSYTDSGLTTGIGYCYTVAAVFSSGTSTDSSPVCGTTITGFAPTGLTVTRSGNGQLSLAWVSGSSIATSYLIKRSVNGGAFTTLVSSQSALTYVDTGLTNYSTAYCYVVDAVLNGVASSDSMAVCNSPIYFVTVGNASFETPATTTYVYNPTGASWTFTASATALGSGVTTNSSGFTAGGAVAPDGTQVAFLQGKGSVAQTITGLTVGQLYTVTVAAEQRQNKSGGQLGNPFTMNVGGTTISTVTAPQTPASYADYSASFTATGTSTALAFAGTNALATTTYPDNTVFLDNVRVSALGNGPVALNVPAATVAQGTAYAVLTATATFGGTATPAGVAVFQVGGGAQVAATCTVSAATETCTAAYPTGNLAVGNSTITVSYLGDPNYGATSAAATLSVVSTGTAQLLTVPTITRLADGTYQVTLSISNSGSAAASATTVTGLVVGAANAQPLPLSVGTLYPGATATVTAVVPATAGTPGSAVAERIVGSYTGGSFGASIRTHLP